MGFSRISPSELSEKSNLLQTGFWARFKSDFGFRPEAFERDGKQLLVLSRNIKGVGRLCYVPHAPSDIPDIPLADYCSELVPLLEKRPFLLRLDLPWDAEQAKSADMKGMKKSVSDIQVPHTVIVDLDGTEEELLSRMKPKTRYNVKLADKKNVEIFEAGKDRLAYWHELSRITAERDKISIHSLEYHKKQFDLAEDYQGIDFKLYLAQHEQDLLAGIIVAMHGKNASYLYGASSNVKRNLMPAYALQWRAMRDAKKAGCLGYDMCGIPEADDPAHPMHGLYRFKTGFGGNIVHRQGCMDYPVKPLIYGLSRQAEKARYYYHKVWKKR